MNGGWQGSSDELGLKRWAGERTFEDIETIEEERSFTSEESVTRPEEIVSIFPVSSVLSSL